MVCDLGLENNIEFTGFLDDHDDVISYMKSSLSEYDVAAKILMGLERGKGMAKRCIESAMGYDWDSISKLTESIYEEVIT